MTTFRRAVHSGLSKASSEGNVEIRFSSGSGGNVFDTAARAYADFVLGYGSVVVGHADVSFNAHVAAALASGTMLPGYSEPHEELLSLLLGNSSPDLRAAFFKSGSEAVTAALRLTACHSSKLGVVRCGFVGWHDAALGRSVRWHEPLYSPLRHGARFAEGFRGIEGKEAVFNWSTLDVSELELIFDQHQDVVGTFILDAYQARFCGTQVLEAALDLCRRRGILVVLDNTKLSGRVSPLGFIPGSSLWGDLVIVGKALGNGLPISILFGASDLMTRSEEVRITGTFASELSSIHGALWSYHHMHATDGYRRLLKSGGEIAAHFRSAISEASLEDYVSVDDIFGGAMFEVSFDARIVGDWAAREALQMHLASAGVLILQGHCSYPCIAHLELDWARVAEGLRAGLSNWRDRLPGRPPST